MAGGHGGHAQLCPGAVAVPTADLGKLASRHNGSEIRLRACLARYLRC